MPKKKSSKKKASKKIEVSKKEVEEKNFVVVYSGVAGKKAVSLKSAVVFAKEYIADGKCKKAYVYELVKKVE